MEFTLIQYAVFLFAAIIGFFSHMLKSIRQEPAEQMVTMASYIRNHPNQTFAMIIGTAAMLGFFHEMGQLSWTTAFVSGYVADSAADLISGRSVKRIQ